jgi:phage protein D
MELAELSSTYADFYAPVFSVRVGGDDLMRDLLLAVSQVEADLELGTMSRFSFTVVDSYDIELGTFLTGRGSKVLELLKFGTEVDVCMGYGDAKRVPVIVSGVVTSITTSFPETGTPELAISGFDHAYLLSLGTQTRTWSTRRESDAVQEIAGIYNLNANVQSTKEQAAQIEQNQQSDLDFVKKLAERHQFEVYVDEKRTLHFHAPNEDAAPVVRLAWGQGLLTFKPEASLAGQVSKVEVYGWDPKQKQAFVGTAHAGEETGLHAGEQSGGQRLSAFVRDPKKQPVQRIRQPVFTQSEADARAKAALNERSKRFMTGDAESIGLPEIRPDRNVFLDNLGKPFSKTYYVQQSTHRVDANGYRTRFKVKGPGQ